MNRALVLLSRHLYKDATKHKSIPPLRKCSVNKLKGTSVTTSMSYLCWDIRCRLMMFQYYLYFLLFDFSHLVYNAVAHPRATFVRVT